MNQVTSGNSSEQSGGALQTPKRRLGWAIIVFFATALGTGGSFEQGHTASAIVWGVAFMVSTCIVFRILSLEGQDEQFAKAQATRVANRPSTEPDEAFKAELRRDLGQKPDRP